MKYKLKYLLLYILPVMVLAGCHKTATPAEETLSVKLSAAAIETIPSSSFPLTVTVQSNPQYFHTDSTVITLTSEIKLRNGGTS